jgi:predicted ATPase/DNA-binding SARP family transcriptional activator
VIRLLGPFEVDDLDPGGALRRLGGSRQQSVLAVLACDFRQVISRAHLVDLLWEEPPATAVGTIQVYVSKLRQALSGTDAVIETTPTGYRLTGPEALVDAVVFERCLNDAERLLHGSERDRTSRAVDLLEHGLGLWRGPALDGFERQPFAGPAAARLEELRLHALNVALGLRLELGRTGEVVADLERLVVATPLHEELWALLVVALYRAGRQAEALRAYQRARRELIDSLGIEPGPRLQALELAVLSHDPVLLSPEVTSGFDVVAGVPRGAAGGSERPVATAAVSLVVEPVEPSVSELGAWPTPTTTFIGRTAEIEAVCELTERGRFVTVTGVGGIGKSRLVREVARELARRHSYEAHLFVDASNVRDRAQLLAAFARAMGNAAISAGTDALLAAIGERELLIVVDRCEQMLACFAEVADELLAGTRGTQLLATSRSPIGHGAETIFEVPPLSFPERVVRGSTGPSRDELVGYDAVKLFAARAPAIGSELPLSLSAGEVAVVAELCRRLDGLPLAIELAASATATLSLDDVARQLVGALRLEISAGGPAHESIHRTLGIALDWSYELAAPSARLLFRRLGAFRGAFDAEAAIAVCADGGVGAVGGEQADVAVATARGETLSPDRVPLVLSELVTLSLVSRPQRGTELPYRLLETVALFARARLAEHPEELEHVVDGHLAYALVTARRLEQAMLGAEPAKGLEMMDRFEPDLLAAVETAERRGRDDAAIELGLVAAAHYLYRFRLAEGADLLAHLASLRGAPESLRARVCYWRSTIDVMADDFDGAAQHCDEGLVLARGSGDRHGEGLLLTRMAEVVRTREQDLPLAAALLGQALAIARDRDDRRLEAEVDRVASVLAWDQGELDQAEATARHWRAIGLRLGDARIAADAGVQLAGIVLALGRPNEADELYREVSAFFATTGDPFERAYAIYCRSRAAHQEGRYDAARQLAAESLEAFVAIGDRWGQAIAQRSAGQAAHALGELEEAEHLLRRALDILEGLGYPDDIAGTINELAKLELATGDLEHARKLVTEALSRLGPDRVSRHRGPLLTTLALATGLAGDARESERLLGEATAECTRSRWAVALGELEAARQALEEIRREHATVSEHPAG